MPPTESRQSSVRIFALVRPDGSTLNHAYFSERHAEQSLPSWSRALGEELRVVSWPVEEDSMVCCDIEDGPDA